MTNATKKAEKQRKRGQGEGSIYQRKDGRWCATINLGYENSKLKRKSFYGRTRADVQKDLTKALRDHEQGLPVISEKQTVAKFIDQWLENNAKPSVRPQTYRSYEQIVRLYLIPKLGHLRLAKLGPQNVQTMMKALSQEVSTHAAGHARTILRIALGQALKWGLVARNVATLVDPPRHKKLEIKPLTPEEANIFLQCIKGDRLEALFIVALYMGLRRGEILGLRWDDINFDAQTLRVKKSLQRIDGKLQLDEPKSKHSRRALPLPETVMQALRAHRSRQLEERMALGCLWPDNNLVFTSEVGTPLEPRNVIRKFHALMGRPQKSKAKSTKRKRTTEKVRKTPSLPHLRFHDLRHSCATLLLAQGVPLKVVSDILGHSQISLTADTYAHVLPAVRQEALNAIDSLLKAN